MHANDTRDRATDVRCMARGRPVPATMAEKWCESDGSTGRERRDPRNAFINAGSGGAHHAVEAAR